MPFNKKDHLSAFSGIWFDIMFFFRILRQWIFVILCMSIVCGISGYLLVSLKSTDLYYASATVSVIPRNNADSYMSDGNVDDAVARNVDMWNSDMLLDEIEEANPDRNITGSLYAESVEGTNLVELTSTADTAENAYFLLHAALRNYKSVAENFDTNYYALVLTNVHTRVAAVTESKARKYGLLGFAGAFAVGLFIIFCWAVTTDLIHKESQAEKLLDFPIYGSMVHIRKEKEQKGLLLNTSQLPLDYLESLDYVTSRVEEHMANRGQKVVLVTSSYENEGKTTAAANMALNLARRGRHILLMDMDFRRPGLYKIFDKVKEQEESLSDSLTKGSSLDDSIETLSDTCWNLDVLWQFATFNDADSILEEVLPSKELNRLKGKYDYIVIDTPPVQQVRDTDIIARFADCSLLVIREDACKASSINDLSDHLEESGAPCIGAVLNNCQSINRKRKSPYGYSDSERSKRRGLR